ncbi:DUF38 domain-containing protein [Entamoeba marina]
MAVLEAIYLCNVVLYLKSEATLLNFRRVSQKCNVLSIQDCLDDQQLNQISWIDSSSSVLQSIKSIKKNIQNKVIAVRIPFTSLQHIKFLEKVRTVIKFIIINKGKVIDANVNEIISFTKTNPNVTVTLVDFQLNQTMFKGNSIQTVNTREIVIPKKELELNYETQRSYFPLFSQIQFSQFFTMALTSVQLRTTRNTISDFDVSFFKNLDSFVFESDISVITTFTFPNDLYSCKITMAQNDIFSIKNTKQLKNLEILSLTGCFDNIELVIPKQSKMKFRWFEELVFVTSAQNSHLVLPRMSCQLFQCSGDFDIETLDLEYDPNFAVIGLDAPHLKTINVYVDDEKEGLGMVTNQMFGVRNIKAFDVYICIEPHRYQVKSSKGKYFLSYVHPTNLPTTKQKLLCRSNEVFNLFQSSLEMYDDESFESMDEWQTEHFSFPVSNQ